MEGTQSCNQRDVFYSLLFFVKNFFPPATNFVHFQVPSVSLFLFCCSAVQCNAVWKREEERKKKGTWYLATSGGYNSPIHTSVREETAATVKDRKSDMFS